MKRRMRNTVSFRKLEKTQGKRDFDHYSSRENEDKGTRINDQLERGGHIETTVCQRLSLGKDF